MFRFSTNSFGFHYLKCLVIVKYAQLKVLKLRNLCLPKAFFNEIKIIVIRHVYITFRGPCPEGKIIMMENQGKILSSC
jgi:hypothetical protein